MADPSATSWRATPSGLWVPPAPDRPLRAVDLFCGCGGFSLGLHAAGIDVVAAMEWWPVAAITYLWNLGSRDGCAVGYVAETDRTALFKAFAAERKRRPNPLDISPGDDRWVGWNNHLQDGHGCRAMLLGDATHATGEQIMGLLALTSPGPIDIVCGGPPCQGISTSSGKARPDDPRNNLLFEYLRLVSELDPRVWIMENVPPLIVESRFAPLWAAFVERANGYGYDIAANILDASHYGVPQHRRRVVVVGTKPGAPLYRFPMPTHWGFTHRVDGAGVDMLGRREADEEEEPATAATAQMGLGL